jgi:hypothetical protein
MGNIKNYYFNKIDARVSNSDYWDFYLASDDSNPTIFDGIISGDCLVAHYDFNEDIFSTSNVPYAPQYANQYGSGFVDDKIYSLTTWNEAINLGVTATTWGLTGIDNGQLTFDKLSIDTTNTALTQTLTGSTLLIESGETRLILTQVTGSTGDFIYPLELVTENSSVGQYVQLCGGFYQGYYALDGYDYQVLPNRVPKSWTTELWLRPRSSGSTVCPEITANTSDAIYSGVSLTKLDSQRTVSVGLPNHGMSVGDLIFVSATTSDFYFLPDTGGVTTVTNVINNDTFQYQGSVSIVGFPTFGSGTITLYDKTCYTGVTLNKFSITDIEVPITGLTTSDYISVSGITTSATTGEFTPNIFPSLNGYGTIDSVNPSGFTYKVFNLSFSTPVVATGDVCTYSVRQIVEPITQTTLNDWTGTTDTEGFFLYFGTRAENKFWNQFEGLNTGSTSGCTGTGTTEWCTPVKETDVSYVDSSGLTISLSPPPTTYYETDNGFLIYSQTEDGYTVRNWTQGDTLVISGTAEEVTNTQNPFLIYRQGGLASCTSSATTAVTAKNFSGTTTPITELDKNADVIDNALGFRIKEDGSIGYRLLTVTASCVNEVTTTGVTIEEAYSASGAVTNDQWSMISIRFVANGTLDECELTYKPPRKGKLLFYVDRRLIWVVDDFDEFIARRLIEHRDKQLTVPFNISLGGGSQGLLESMTFDGQDPDDLGCNIEKYFGGTFIGDISQFRFYICDMDYCMISNNFNQEKSRYGK